MISEDLAVKQEMPVSTITVLAGVLKLATGQVLDANNYHNKLVDDLEQALGRPLEADDSRIGKTESIWRPRQIGAIAIAVEEAKLMGYNESELLRNQILAKTFYTLGSAQDDPIDDYILKQDDTVYSFQEATFRKPEIIDAIWKVFERRLEESDHTKGAKELIRKRVVDYFDLVYKQEYDNKRRDPADFTFEYCLNYRLNQNTAAAKTVLAMMFGEDSNDVGFQTLGDKMGTLSILTQSLDDVSDLVEDIQRGGIKPSIAIGAATTAGEMDKVNYMVELVRCNKLPSKLTLDDIHAYAPKTWNIINEQLKTHLESIRKWGNNGEVYAFLQEALSKYYLQFRNVLYSIFGDKVKSLTAF